ncbi:MAG TPA: protein kinase [Thermoanaerobaculia bacterium]|nr:protein kinase [Thermoanaerobaculia bacterium]
MPLSNGTKIGPYEILAPLGAGGMGEVYRARDPRLGRDVALKVLPEEFTTDRERLVRFEQEARAASALNHPGIVVVHDIGSAEGRAYIAMELVDGRTLRALLEDGAVPIRKLLDIATQLAEALAKAHDSGIVHRDLKPENVIVSKDGYVKVLDFGLARQTDRRGSDSSELPTQTGTAPGTVMGTVGYMSPEQAAGRPVDFRSDQFSLGSMVYEMSTGKRAFERGTSAETLTAIIREEPEPISTANARIPAPLRWIVERCLAKDAEDRFASTKDLARDLKSLRDHLTETSASLQSGVSAAIPIGRVRSLRRRAIAATAVAAVLAVALAISVLKPRRPPGGAVFHRLTFQRGAIWGARFTPDGGSIVYGAAWDGQPSHLYTVRADNLLSSPLDLPPAFLLGISRQSEVALAKDPIQVTTLQILGTLARAPLSGGSPREVESRVSFADWTPDGTGLAVVRDVGGRADLFYPEDHLLYASQGWASHPRFSPDGKWIAFLDHASAGDGGSVVLVSTDGRTRRTLASGFSTVQGLAWRADGKEIWFTGTAEGNARALCAVTPSGKMRTLHRVPATLTLYDIAKDGRLLVEQEDQRSSTFALAPGETRERDLSALDWSGLNGFSTDGRLVSFDETGEGGGESGSVYIRRTDGSSPLLLGTGGSGGFSSDGSWVAGYGLEGSTISLFPTAAGKSRTIRTSLVNVSSPQFVAGAMRLVVRGAEKGHNPRYFVLDAETGAARAISEEGIPFSSYTPTSPDGTRLLGLSADFRPTIYPIAGGAAVPVLGSQPREYPAGWSTDGRAIYVYLRSGSVAPVYRVDLATGKRELWKTITAPDAAGITGIAPVIVVMDGKAYAYGVTRILSSLYLVDGFR